MIHGIESRKLHLVVKLQKVQCPSCGAPLSLPVDRLEQKVECSYCRHTFLWHRPTEPPPEVLERKTGKTSGIGAWAVLPILFSVTLTLGIGGFVAFRTSSELKKAFPSGVGSSSGFLGGVARARVRFRDSPLLADVNGDGQSDVIGHSDEAGGDSFLAAFNGKDGHELWRSRKLTNDESDAQALRAIHGDWFFSADALGKLQAFHVKTGGSAWAAMLGERAREFCGLSNAIRIRLEDSSELELELTTGKKMPRSAQDCQPVPDSRGDRSPSSRLISWSEFKKHGLPGLHDVEGFSLHRALVPGAGGSAAPKEGASAFLLGTKSAGTRYPVVVAVLGKKVLWSDAVAGMDPLATETNVTTQSAAWLADRLVIPYAKKGSKGIRMACFDTASGQRLWDVAVHEGSQVENGISLAEGRIFYSTWTSVYILDLKTGQRVSFIGEEF